jgi:Rrf2 family transcriptional regulator, iron-sulfur cluster assembly transcription factor
MLRYGKTAQSAVSAMSRLAEVYDGGETCLSSLDIAKHRHLPQPLVAKLLTVLSRAGLVDGTRGPGGGYWLARPPGEITLEDIVKCFERDGDRVLCPFGPGWCGNSDPCPLHFGLLELDQNLREFLQKNTLEAFAGQPKSAAAIVD